MELVVLIVGVFCIGIGVGALLMEKYIWSKIPALVIDVGNIAVESAMTVIERDAPDEYAQLEKFVSVNGKLFQYENEFKSNPEIQKLLRSGNIFKKGEPS